MTRMASGVQVVCCPGSARPGAGLSEHSPSSDRGSSRMQVPHWHGPDLPAGGRARGFLELKGPPAAGGGGPIPADSSSPHGSRRGPCATLPVSMLTYYRTSRSLHFPFWAVCSLSGSHPEIWSVSWKRPVHGIACRLFVVPLNPTLRSSSRARAEGERAPGSSGPVHSGRTGPRGFRKRSLGHP